MIFCFADFEIDVARHELRRKGEVVPIEPQVFDLLVHLVRNRNRIVSKNELISAVWHGRVISDASLSSRVSTARRAIGDNGDDQVLIRTHHKRGFRFIGNVKNNSSPDTLAAIPARNLALASKAATAPALVQAEKPSIAVLPFQNMSGDPEQEYLADGLTEDIITGLSRWRWFSVIARNCSFSLKGKAIDIRKVACELGVQYVLEGSVRKAADRVRVTAQLSDVTKRVQLWADRYDSVFVSILDHQDEITNRIIASVRSQVIMAESARVRRQLPENMGAPDLVIQALPHMWRTSAEEQRLAQELLQQAITLDAGYAYAHALLGWTYASMFNLQSHTPIGELTERALDAGAKALTLNNQEHWGHLVLGLGYARRRRPEAAVTHLSKSIDLNPNFALGHAGLGYAFACGGQPERALKSLARAQRLSPFDPFLAIYAPVVQYMALFALGQYEETLTVCRAMAARYPHHVGARRLMTVSLGLLDRADEAKESLAHTLALQPDLSSDHVANNTVYADASDRCRFLLGLQKAGLRD